MPVQSTPQALNKADMFCNGVLISIKLLSESIGRLCTRGAWLAAADRSYSSESRILVISVLFLRLPVSFVHYTPNLFCDNGKTPPVGSLLIDQPAFCEKAVEKHFICRRALIIVSAAYRG
jgi:hypothetical protein